MYFDDWGIMKNLLKSQQKQTITFEKDLDIIETGKITSLEISEDQIVIQYVVENEETIQNQEMIITKKQFVSCSDAKDYTNTETYDGIRLLVKPIGWIVLG